MKQTLHIFAKDVRLFYPEILLSLVVMALFVRIYPQNWGDPAAGPSVFVWLPSAMTALVPVSWLVLITRVILAESLVGERQFWLTRPYQWPKLLAAKWLFFCAFLYLPFLLAQCALLAEAGLHPTVHLGGIFYNLLLTTGIVVLPLIALATVTGNFAKMLLGVLIVLVFAGAAGYATTLLPTASPPGTFGDRIAFIVPISIFVAVIVVQYATRRTLLGRALLGALALTLAGLGLFGPDDAATRLTYPVQAATESGVRLALRMDTAETSGSRSDASDSQREVSLAFPLTVSGIAPGSAVKAEAAKVKITASDGESWESHWQSTFPAPWLPGETATTLSLKINRAFFERTKQRPVTVKLSVALTELGGGKAIRMTLPEASFTLPNGSKCKAAGIWTNDISCLSPLRQPPLTLVMTRFSTDECSAGVAPANDGDTGLGWMGTLDNDPAEFGITSVWISWVNFQRFSSEKSSEHQHLCAGSPISFTPYSVSGRNMRIVTAQSIQLNRLLPAGWPDVDSVAIQ